MPSPQSEDSTGSLPKDAADKRFRCLHPGCTKAFARKDYLERHAANHLTARPFVCPTCSKAYARADVLKRHTTNHPTRGRKFKAALAQLAVAGERVTPPGQTPLPDHETQATFPVDAPTSPPLNLPGMDILSKLTYPTSSDPQALSTLSLEKIDNDNAPLNELYSWFLGTDIASDDLTSAADEAPYDWTTLFDLSSVSTPEVSEEIVNTESWQGLQDFITSIGCTPPSEGLSEEEAHQYVELYFQHFQPLFPILHRPTLRSRGCHPMLLLSIILFGSVYVSSSSNTPSSSSSGLDKVDTMNLQRRLRLHLFDILETTKNPPLYVFQALFLGNYYGRMYANAASHDINQIYHSAGVTAARFHGLFTPPSSLSSSSPSSSSSSRNTTEASEEVPQEYRWMKWAAEEERIRLAWMVFVFDTFSAGILRHSVMLQCFSLSIRLPCASSLWQAPSFHSWSSLHPTTPSPPSPAASLPFRPAIKQILEDSRMDDTISPFGRWCILHGLVSLTWSLSVQGADVFTLARRAQITVWKGIVYNALMGWQHRCMSDLSATCASTRGVGEREGEGGGEYGLKEVTQAGVPLCTICVITLLTDMDSVRILAGAQKMNGRDISAEDRTAARASLETWAQSSEGRQSCWCAVGMLQLVYQWIQAGEIDSMPPSTLWCIYLATLVVWIFTALIEERPIKTSPSLIPLSTRCLIRAPLALQTSQSFLERVLASEDPINLPAVSNLEDCTALVAYAAHLCGDKEWGGLDGATRVLYGLLKHVELTRKQWYANC
ncbi:hypothetical protein L202_03171 [Cryptococcus amylolentus CBS 6039]|uniref:C2H2-type domain-containing protein n=1 Tax=Cryptococcus amylolentus CBS 6039 TaxID=1295533 RepID=A0A1E3HZA8_9TREE|nr:hypothetical protein L202_03171 [Cryptococcus amylolentus CBS 6039]ODN81076.1 hypothetical protein L202_03171 [Cryptococcus amylolentus CBS 6039]